MKTKGKRPNSSHLPPRPPSVYTNGFHHNVSIISKTNASCPLVVILGTVVDETYSSPSQLANANGARGALRSTASSVSSTERTRYLRSKCKFEAVEVILFSMTFQGSCIAVLIFCSWCVMERLFSTRTAGRVERVLKNRIETAVTRLTCTPPRFVFNPCTKHLEEVVPCRLEGLCSVTAGLTVPSEYSLKSLYTKSQNA